MLWLVLGFAMSIVGFLVGRKYNRKRKIAIEDVRYQALQICKEPTLNTVAELEADAKKLEADVADNLNDLNLNVDDCLN